MTLCAVWRENDEIKFAADTRISFNGELQHFDGAHKISPLRMEVDLVNPVCLSDEAFFYGNIGLCFAGSSFNAFVLKDTLIQALRGLLIIDCREIPPFSHYVDKAFEIYTSLSREICHAMAGPAGLATVALGGYCFNQQRYQAYVFTPNPADASFEKREVALHNGDYVLFGSGKQAALTRLKDSQQGFNTQMAKHVIESVIACERVPSVGGQVQTGQFDRKHSFFTSQTSFEKR